MNPYFCLLACKRVILYNIIIGVANVVLYKLLMNIRDKITTVLSDRLVYYYIHYHTVLIFDRMNPIGILMSTIYYHNY